MAGTDSTPVFDRDGQYISLLADNDITIGNVVQITATGIDTCDVGAANKTIIGVAVGGDRYSRTQTDNVISAGSNVTVCTRGIVRVYTGTSTILRGSYVEAGAAGVVELAGTAGTASDIQDVIGIALDGNAGAADTIRIKLLRG
ncbi:MAG: hypothetical protein PHP65_00610 [Bacilli bacterium]|nr:hypothetical protein [Bacilli bacterium]